MQTEKKYKRSDDKKMDRAIRDRGDLRRNLINSVFESLKVEDCLADRGDAKENPVRQRNHRTVLRPLKPSLEPRRSSEAKNPKINNARKTEAIKTDKEKDKENRKKTETIHDDDEIVIEDPQIEECLRKLTKFSTDRRNEVKIKQPSKHVLTVKKEKAPEKSEGQTKTYLDAEGRKFLRQRYTVKLKNSNKNCVEEANINESPKLLDDTESKKQTDDETEKAKSKSAKNSEQSEHKKKQKEPTQRKPIIKTIKINNDNRIYKAVTFVDQKPTMPIQIKIPSDYQKAKPELKNKMTTVSKDSLPIKPRKKEKRQLRKTSPSPEINRRGSPMMTEVAKWVPSCLNQHTKPYYEAWVNTTLAAITKCSKHDKLYVEQQNMIKAFKRAVDEKSEASDFVYEHCNDERYTGKIKIRQKS